MPALRSVTARARTHNVTPLRRIVNGFLSSSALSGSALQNVPQQVDRDALVAQPGQGELDLG
jgi:hypothetical protein